LETFRGIGGGDGAAHELVGDVEESGCLLGEIGGRGAVALAGGIEDEDEDGYGYGVLHFAFRGVQSSQ
jgi:hypothetical protein